MHVIHDLNFFRLNKLFLCIVLKMGMLKKLFLIALIFSAISNIMVYGQTTTNCLEIESILVDACVPGTNCGSVAAPTCNCEGKNEMVRFLVGPNPIATSNLAITWPNNSYQGICQDASTAAIVATLNSTIQSCGFLLEPTGGILPANKKVLLITSTDMCVTANSFTNLSDTMYVIFQCPGNFQGHFANYGIGLRTTIIGTAVPACSDVVTYDRSLLITQAGIPGAEDGATVNFTQDGTPTYVNEGCNAPVTQFSVDAGVLNAIVCPGGSVTLPGSVSGITSFIQWTGGSGTFANPSLPNTVYQYGPNDVDGTILILKAISACQDTLSDTLFLPVAQPNPIVISPTDPIQNLCAGQQLTLTASGGGGSYFWTGGSSGNTLTVNSAGTIVVSGNDACYSYSDTVQVNLIQLPVAAITPSGPTSFCTGGSVTLNASGGSNYVWSNFSTQPSITVSAGGLYIVSAINQCGVDTASVLVTVSQTEQAIIQASGPLELCPGQSVTLGSNFSSGFSWNTGNPNQSFTTSTPGTYILTVNNSCGITTDTAVVTALTNPVAVITPNGPTTFCQGGSVTLTASGGSNYSWNTGQQTSQITVNSANTYTVTASNVCGSSTASINVNILQAPSALITASGSLNLCNGSSVTLTSNSATNNLWSTGDTTQSITVTQAGSYQLTVSNFCGAATDNVVVTTANNPVAVINASGPLTFCQGGSVTLTASGGTSYSWSSGQQSASINVNASGTYTVTVTNACGSAAADVVVDVIPLPAVSVAPANTANFCTGATVDLTATTNVPQNLIWSNNQTTPTIAVSIAGTYTATVTNACGTASASVVVSETPQPQAAIITSGPTNLCNGESVTLTFSGVGNPIWSTGAQTNSIVVNSTANITVTATNSCGSVSANQNVTVSGPTAQFIANPPNGSAPLNVLFTNNSTGGTIFSWSFGDGGSSTVNSPSHTYNDAGSFVAQLIVIDANGCTDTATTIILVDDEVSISFPNIFTPNGDSFNEYFKVSATGIKDFNTTIYNRWGNLIFTLTDPTQEWDGNTKSGSEASPGVYFVVVNYTTTLGKAGELKGTLTLTR